MSQPLDSAIRATVARIDHYIEVHRSHPEIELHAHIRMRRRERAERANSLKLIYLDTNAWKCIADYRQSKTNLSAAMRLFGASMERAIGTGKFAFPIGLPTYFELDSMTDPVTRRTINLLVDEYSQGFCITPFQDRVGSELYQLRMGNLNPLEGLKDFLCSPIELLGIPTISSLGFLEQHVDKVTFNKAFFDAVAELPFSVQLDVAGTSPDAKWDNSCGIADLNAGRIKHQSGTENLNTGIFLELRGCIESWFRDEEIAVTPQDINLYAINAQYHWHEAPSSKALPTLRVLSSLYGLMRFDVQRQYKKGDPNDFMVAASAIPIAHALFTDRKLANLLSDSRIKLNKFSNCVVISGFEEMAKYIDDQLT